MQLELKVRSHLQSFYSAMHASGDLPRPPKLLLSKSGAADGIDAALPELRSVGSRELLLPKSETVDGIDAALAELRSVRNQWQDSP